MIRTNDIRIVFEDEWLLVVSKPPGLPVHASAGRDGDDLESLLRKQRKRSLVLFHRLDADTTGLVVLGKRPEINRTMTEAFEKKRIRKSYMAVVEGRWRPEWNRVETFIDRGPDGRWTNFENPPGKRALTTFRVLKASDEKSWVEAILKTGRTHQIRLHCLAKGCPILGDRVYGHGKAEMPPQALHAYRMDLQHPVTGDPLRLVDPPPAYWTTEWLRGLPVDEAMKRLFAPNADSI